MNATNQLLLTPKGLDKIRTEYKLLKKRYHRLSEELRDGHTSGADDSRLLNGLRRVEQEFLQGKLDAMDKMLKRAKLMVRPHSQTASLGSEVVYEVMDQRWSVTLVESIEADPLDGRVSVTSPLGKALKGTMAGDRVTVLAPKRQYEVAVISVD